MTDLLAASLGRLGTETAFEVLARARALEAEGRPHHPSRDRRARLHDARAHHRGGGEGAPRRRDALLPGAGDPRPARGLRRPPLAPSRLSIEPSRIVVTPGAKPFLFFGVLATCDPGDEVIYPNPGFPIYESVIKFAGATPVPLPLVEERGFAFSAQDLADRLTPRTKMVILNSPANPTGGIVEREPERRDRAVCSPTTTAGSSPTRSTRRCSTTPSTTRSPRHEGLLERTILLDGFSKTFAMTGWRLGYAALPESLVEPIVATADQLGLVHGPCDPARGRRGAHRAARRGERDARRVPAGAATPSSPG